MTIDELAQTLPNGFHDAEVDSIRIDYVRREIEMEMHIWVGDVSSADFNERECYCLATLTLSGLRYCCIEPPDSCYPYQKSRSITVDTRAVESLTKPPQTQLPDSTHRVGFTNWFFVQQWNSFIYVSAQTARLTWRAEPG